MKRKLAKIEKSWDKGEKLYDSFCGMFKGFKVFTPRTNSLKLFALLHEKKENELLLRVMMEEFISNLDDSSVGIYTAKDNNQLTPQGE
ncbi:MAG: hypothetical protein A2Y67_03840 [Candidatus Buchananbacteria bacterium RBG_13_39_9]|uniref:Uncharacterized protein n=1 Tax=Candidatus Buchananbacteria bacterium RBG_13_39_9 TaxID=1797531 RepID=A0A1G1XPN9_9BACT|nr:MAG: hypothetical protein A2Y67_03840 [Candidatus Buchananbacteria bacterium RBG_13_39_9]